MAKVTLTFVIEDVVDGEGDSTVNIEAHEQVENTQEGAEMESSRILSWIIRSIPENEALFEEVSKRVVESYMESALASEVANGVSGSEEEAGSTP